MSDYIHPIKRELPVNREWQANLNALDTVEAGNELLEEPPHLMLIAGEVRESVLGSTLLWQQLSYYQFAELQDKPICPVIPVQSDPGECAGCNPNIAHIA